MGHKYLFQYANVQCTANLMPKKCRPGGKITVLSTTWGIMSPGDVRKILHENFQLRNCLRRVEYKACLKY